MTSSMQDWIAWRICGGLRTALTALVISTPMSTVLIASLFAGDAKADYYHLWNCGAQGSTATCYDPDTSPNPWLDVQNSTTYQRYNVCAKAVTDASNIKSGSGCSTNATYRCSSLAAASPYSTGYTYWAGTGGSVTNDGRADTWHEC